jgi:hypothetical protein
MISHLSNKEVPKARHEGVILYTQPGLIKVGAAHESPRDCIGLDALITYLSITVLRAKPASTHRSHIHKKPFPDRDKL